MAIAKLIFNGVTQMDLTSDTVEADNLLEGFTAHGADGEPILGTATGGGSQEDGCVYFIDYDGTVLHEYTYAQWENVSALPTNPSHTGLVAQGWNWTKAQIDNQIEAVGGDVWVGQMYDTQSGATEIDITIDDYYKVPELRFRVYGTATIDWGDGTSSTQTGTGGTTYAISHNYGNGNARNYTISISTSGNDYITFYGATSTYLLGTYYVYCVNSIRVGSNCKEIGQYAFRYLKGQYITIPNGITSIGNSAMTSASFQCVILPSSVTTIGTSAFSSNRVLKKVSLPTGISEIPTSCFGTCQALYGVTIPSTVETIGSSAFSQCNGLGKISIPDDVESVGSSAFAETGLKQIAFPSGITELGSSVVSGCKSLDSIKLPPELETIGTNAFMNCSALKSIEIPESVTQIGDNAFNGCTNLISLAFSEDAEVTVGGNFCNGATALRSVTLPSSDSSFGSSTFNSCYCLNDVRVPSGTTTLSANSFTYCYSLKNVSLPNTLTAIGSACFSYCSDLKQVTIPASVTSIGNNAFYGCSALRKIRFEPTAPPAVSNSNAWTSANEGFIISVPVGSLSAYTSASNYPASSTHAYIEE